MTHAAFTVRPRGVENAVDRIVLDGRHAMQGRALLLVEVSLSVLLVLTLGVEGVAAKRAIRIGEINSYSGPATVFTFPY